VSLHVNGQMAEDTAKAMRAKYAPRLR
jgi:hypothetical protein